MTNLSGRSRRSSLSGVTGWRLGKRPALDGIRGIAIVLVMCAHLGLRGFRAGGTSGVTLFFVLSGFLITSLLVEEQRETSHLDVRAFYLRRALRLLPALALLILVVALHKALASRFSEIPYDAAPGHLSEMVLSSSFYAANWSRAYGHTLGHLSHLWSLAIEEQFYLVWPAVLLVLAPARSGRRWKAAMLVTGVAAFVSLTLRFALWGGAGSIDRVYFGTDTNAVSLLVGCLLALWLTAEKRLPAPRLFGLVGLAALVLATWDGSVEFTFTWGPTLAGLGGVGLIAWAVTRGMESRILTTRPLRHLGRLSYGLYLWHVPIFNELDPYVYGHNVLVRVVVSFVPSYAAAWLSFRLVETPFLRLKRQLKRDPLASGTVKVTGDAPAPQPSG